MARRIRRIAFKQGFRVKDMSIYELIHFMFVIGIIILLSVFIYLLMKYVYKIDSRIYDRDDILYRKDQIIEKHNNDTKRKIKSS